MKKTIHTNPKQKNRTNSIISISAVINAVIPTGIVCLFVTILFFPVLTSASTIYIESDNTTINSGDTTVFNVYLDTENKDVNVVEGNISLQYESGAVQINNILIAGSDLSLWPRKPTLSSKEDNIEFVGGTQEGINSPKAFLFKVFLSFEKSGQTTINPNNVFVYLNDGKGTKETVSPRKLTLNINPRDISTPSKNDFHSIISTDTVAPQPFEIFRGQDDSVFDGQKFITYNTTDNQSGISHYEVKENDLSPVRTGNTYVLQDQKGRVKVVVKAYDLAGNYSQSTYNSGFDSLQMYISIILIIMVVVITSIIIIRKKWLKK